MDKGQEREKEGIVTAGSDWMQSESTTKLYPFLSPSPSPDSSQEREDKEGGGLNQHGSLVIKDEWTRNQNEQDLDPNAEIIEGRRAVPAFIR